MKKILLLFFISNFFTSIGQKQANNWYFGVNAGMSFNATPPIPLLNGQTNYISTTKQWVEGTTSISDSSGALLFYSNGVDVWNKNHIVMPNGSGLAGHKSATQSSIIIPKPGSQQYFYIFTVDALENNFFNGISYSIVDMCRDNNNGDVITTAKNINLTDSTSEKIATTKHANGTDYWIVTHKFKSDAFYAYQLTSTGITNTVISHTGTQDLQGWGGQMKISPNGQKIVFNIPNGQPGIGRSMLLDLNTTTGVISNEQILALGGREWGAAFSPDNSKLYCSTAGFGSVFQYDLNAGNLAAIIASKIFIISNGPDSWRDQQLAPDGSIYLSRTGKKYISVITNPNSACPSCNYIDSVLYLGGKYTSMGLPNFVSNFDYSNKLVNCDVVTGINSSSKLEDQISIYPNPNNGLFNLQIGSEIKNGKIILINTLGQIVHEQKITGGLNIIQTNHLSKGFYSYILYQGTEKSGCNKLVIE